METKTWIIIGAIAVGLYFFRDKLGFSEVKNGTAVDTTKGSANLGCLIYVNGKTTYENPTTKVQAPAVLENGKWYAIWNGQKFQINESNCQLML